MRTLRNNWAKLAGLMALAVTAVVTIYACVSAWGQTAPVLGIAPTGTNLINVTVLNPATNAAYQIYYREFLIEDYPWEFLTNGTLGQSNFLFNTGDTVSGFFEAVNNASFVPPTINVIILSPTNGALLY
jgi:hypothetical protein